MVVYFLVMNSKRCTRYNISFNISCSNTVYIYARSVTNQCFPRHTSAVYNLNHNERNQQKGKKWGKKMKSDHHISSSFIRQ